MMLQRPALPFLHPATLIATWFGSGLLPKAPGTWGSLAAVACAALLVWLGGTWALLVALVLVLALGLWASERYVGGGDQADPGDVVVDEVAGQWLTLLPLALDPWLYLFGFLAFRLFDVLKPWPIGWLDRNVQGGLGIMADDVAAGVYAGALCYSLALWIGPEPCIPRTC